LELALLFIDTFTYDTGSSLSSHVPFCWNGAGFSLVCGVLLCSKIFWFGVLQLQISGY